MIFSELNRLSKSYPTTVNPHVKIEPRKVRRTKAKQARLEAKNLETTANQNIHNKKKAI